MKPLSRRVKSLLKDWLVRELKATSCECVRLWRDRHLDSLSLNQCWKTEQALLVESALNIIDKFEKVINANQDK